MKADKKEGVGTYCFILLMGLLALPLLLDKAIAHTSWICIKPMMAVQTNDVVLLLSSSQHRNFARISSTKIISITPFKNMSVQKTLVL
ncbi:MAG: hypothetical protein IKJ61_02735 [Bacteroidaceae bacterium]|nr:hypothetical protein [Bacteroidaceae bacterium]